MSQSEKLRIEQLLSAIADEGTSHDPIAELDALLRDRPDLQSHYARAMQMHVHLEYEFNLSMQRSAPLLPQPTRLPRDEGAESRDVSKTAFQVKESRLIPGFADQSRRAWTAFSRSRTAQLTGVAVVLLVTTSVAIWNWRTSGAGDSLNRTVRASSADPNQDREINHADRLVVNDALSLQTFSRLTNTSLPTNIALPRTQLSPSTGLTLCSGTAWIERAPRQFERGYLVALPPGQRMDVFVDTEAETENELSLMELDDQGRVTGQTVAFNNLVRGDASKPDRRIGCVGELSEYNSSSSTRHFLLAGSHLLRTKETKASWRQSDYRVMFDSNDILVIGWDDSGYVTENAPEFDPYRDFNDMRVVLRFSSQDHSGLASKPAVEYSPMPFGEGLSSVDSIADDHNTASYDLDVKPGQELLLMISRAARERSLTQVIEVDSQRVVWQLSLSPDPPKPLSSSIYHIQNHSETVKRYRLRVFHGSKGNHTLGDWHNSSYKVLSRDDESVTLGFSEAADAAWINVYVYARWFSDEPATPPSGSTND